MFGFIFAAFCLFGFFWLWRHGHGRYGHGRYGYERCGHGHRHGCRSHHAHDGAHDAWGTPEEDDERDFGPRRRRRHRNFRSLVHWLNDEIDATPEQERIVQEQLGALYEKTRDLKPALRDARKRVAEGMRAPDFDAERMGQLFFDLDERWTQLRDQFVTALATVHGALEKPQRERLSELLESGPWRRWSRGRA